VSDYNKGTVIPSLIQTLLKSEKLVFVDVKKRTNMFANKETLKYYKNLIVKCNNKEYEEELKDFSIASKCKALVVTNGAKPYSIHVADSEHIADLSETNSSVVDVVGAGDTFLAGMVAAYLLNTENFNVGLLAKFGDSMSRKKVNYFGTKIVKVTD
jgi:sugar/nucleoside kinase (ribokinase family)